MKLNNLLKNEKVIAGLMAFGTMLGSAFLSATSLFLSRVLEPIIAWFTFTSMKLLIKLTKSETLKSLYGEMRKGYKENKGS